MSMAEVIESIEKDMRRELGERIGEPNEEVDCRTLDDKPDVSPKKINTDILKDFPSTNWTLEGMIGSGLKNTKEYELLCSGYKNKDMPCEYIENCNLRILGNVDEDGNEHYLCGLGVPDFQCKRDNPFWRPLTQREFVDLYNKMPGKTAKNVDEILQRAIAEGFVEE